MTQLTTNALRLFLFGTLAALFHRLYFFYPILVPVHPLPTSYFRLPPSAFSNDTLLPTNHVQSSLESSTTGKCHKIRHPSGGLSHCEDLTEWLDTNGDVVGILASCDPNRRQWNTVMGPLRDPNPRGGIWLLSPHTDSVLPLPLNNYPEGHDFHPLGIAVLPSKPGETTTLFAVNHGRHNSTIEVFSLTHPSTLNHSTSGWSEGEEPELEYVRTLTHPKLVSPNAVVPLSPSTLLISQDHTFTRRLPSPLGSTLPMLESLLALPGGSVDVLQFSPSNTSEQPTITPAASRIPFANGLALSPLTNTLAVASSSRAAVDLYHLPVSRPVLLLPLRKKSSIPLPFAPDNLSFSPSGTLYASGHPNFPALIKHSKSASARAGSWVVSVSLEGEVRTVYQSQGGEGEEVIEASTTAVIEEEKGRVWVSGLYAEGILRCDL